MTNISLLQSNTVLRRRWEIVEEKLIGNIPGPFELEDAILAYNSRYAGRWNFETLTQFFIAVSMLLTLTQFFIAVSEPSSVVVVRSFVNFSHFRHLL